MPSFDVVSRTDLMEVDNAVNGMKREIKQRFDLIPVVNIEGKLKKVYWNSTGNNFELPTF